MRSLKNSFSLETNFRFSLSLFFFFKLKGQNSRDISNENGLITPRQTAQCPSSDTFAAFPVHCQCSSCSMAVFSVSCYQFLASSSRFEVLIFFWLRESQDTKNIHLSPSLLFSFSCSSLTVISKHKL